MGDEPFALEIVLDRFPMSRGRAGPLRRPRSETGHERSASRRGGQGETCRERAEAVREEHDRIVYRSNLLGILRRRELARVAGQLSVELGLGYVETKSGEKFEGVYRRHVDLASGRLAVIQKAREFTLAPWRPVDILETLVSAPRTCQLVVNNKLDGQR